jgi:hypothetical protein
MLKTDVVADEEEVKSLKEFNLDDSTFRLTLKCPNSNKTIPLVNYEKHMTEKGNKPQLAWENHNLSLSILNAKDSLLHKYLFDSTIIDYCDLNIDWWKYPDGELGVIQGNDIEIMKSTKIQINILHNPIQNGFLEFTVHNDADFLSTITAEIRSKDGQVLKTVSNLSIENRIDMKNLTSDKLIYLIVKAGDQTESYKILISN